MRKKASCVPLWSLALIGAALAASAVYLPAQGATPEEAELRRHATDDARRLAASIEDRLAAAESLARRGDVLSLIRAVERAPQAFEPGADLRRLAARALEHGFSLVEFRNAAGAVLAAAVSAPADAVLLFALDHHYPVRLLWNDGFVAHVEIPLRGAGPPVGILYAQLPLPALPPARGERFVCGRLNDKARCMPRWHWPAESGPDPLARALAGTNGAESGMLPGGRARFAITPAQRLGLWVVLREAAP